jgi:hypothetical protein
MGSKGLTEAHSVSVDSKGLRQITSAPNPVTAGGAAPGMSSQNIARKEVVACIEREDKGLGSLIDGELLRTFIDGQ